MERAIRGRLDSQGYYGDSAVFKQVKLAAVQRPGWLQVFEFELSARPRMPEDVQTASDDKIQLYGLVRQDERYQKTEVRFFKLRYERSSLFDEWSRDLIRLRRRSR